MEISIGRSLFTHYDPITQIKVLQRISPRKLLEIREDKGYGYHLALDSWFAQQNAENEKEVRRTLRQYSNEIIKLSDESPCFLEVVAEHFSKPTRGLLTATALVFDFFAFSGAGAAVAGSGYAAYRWHATRPQDITVEIKAQSPVTNDRPPEVNLPAASKNTDLQEE